MKYPRPVLDQWEFFTRESVDLFLRNYMAEQSNILKKHYVKARGLDVIIFYINLSVAFA